MTRVLSLLVVAGLVAAAILIPTPTAPDPDLEPGIEPPTFAVCLVEEGAGRTTEVTAASVDEGSIQMSLFANGQVAGSLGVPVGPVDATVIPVVDITALGTVVGLVEMPSAYGAVSVLTRGVGTLAAETCVSTVPDQSSLTGGNTVGENEFDLHLINPFAVDAVVRLAVTSEVGAESNSRFNSVTVLAKSSVMLEMRQLIPNREQISVAIESLQGSVFTVGRQSGPSHGAIWNAVESSIDWFIPLPPEGIPFEVVLGNPSGPDVDYQVDLYSPEGLRPAELSGILPQNGQATLDLTGYPEVRAIRVSASAPMVVALRSSGPQGLAVTTGSIEPSLRWLVPGALAGVDPPVQGEQEEGEVVTPSGRLVIFNPGAEEAVVVVQMLGPNPSVREVVVPASGVLTFDFGAGDAQFVESDFPVVILWMAGAADAFSMGVPLPDG